MFNIEVEFRHVYVIMVSLDGRSFRPFGGYAFSSREDAEAVIESMRDGYLMDGDQAMICELEMAHAA